VTSYRPALTIKGDATRGKVWFTKSCAACHRIGDIGKAIGPNLAAMRNRGAEAILVNVLDPNREVNPQYISYHVTTKDDEHHTGMIIAESATSLTLMRGDGTSLTLLRIQIDTIARSNLSFMPEGLAKALRDPLLKIFPPALLGRLVTIPFYPLTPDMIAKITVLQLNRIKKRVEESHDVPFTFTEAVVDKIVERCQELESGGRMIDAIVTNTMLPDISAEFLRRMMEGKEVIKVAIDVTDEEFSYSFE